MLHLEKFGTYPTDKEIERRMQDISNEYDKSTLTSGAQHPYPTFNGMVFESSTNGDLNGNTTILSNSNRITTNGHLGHIGTPNFQHDKKYLQFSTEQVRRNLTVV